MALLLILLLAAAVFAGMIKFQSMYLEKMAEDIRKQVRSVEVYDEPEQEEKEENEEGGIEEVEPIDSDPAGSDQIWEENVLPVVQEENENNC